MEKLGIPKRQLRMTELTHSFLVPAYRQSPYLRDCLRSLSEQTRKSPILISTSTPFQGLEALAQEFGAQLHVHGPNQGMAHDWNEGLRQVQTDWVTIAHQDDVYLPSYAEQVMSAVALAKAPILAFSNYAELLGADQVRRNTRLLRIKQILLHLAFIGRTSIGDRWSKLNALRFGSPIPCPAVTLKTHPGQPHFETGFRLNMDWAAWIRKAKEGGSFVWIRKELMYHRIHEDSETTDGIVAGYRRDEDMALLCRLWPKPFASLIVRTYGLAYDSNAH